MVKQDACRAGEYGFRGVMDEEALELGGQVPGASPLVPSNCFHDGSGDEVCGLPPLSGRGLADHGAHGAGERDVEQDMARCVGVVGRQDVDGQEPIEFAAE
ncbi:hypothetical protein ABZY05_22880 [Streptomyces canus]|uniref:hypothetical protein n=1 Tax=Streptomyces canus TaxID=58343 RepID=UPI0033BF56A0